MNMESTFFDGTLGGLPSTCYKHCPTYNVTYSNGTALPSWATFYPEYKSGRTQYNTSLMSDTDIGKHDFKYTKYSIDVPPLVIKEETFSAFICKYESSKAASIIPDPVYIEENSI